MEEPPDDDGALGIWPDNVDAVEVFQLAITQWNFSAMGEATGLRYEVLPMLLQAQGVQRKRWREMLEDLQVMELEALRAMRTKE